MMSSYREIENRYLENFSIKEDKGDHIIFRDEKLPDMYAFNCILVKETMNQNAIQSFVFNCLNQAKLNGREFMNILFHPKHAFTEYDVANFLDMGFEANTNLYMKIDGSKATSFRANEDCTVKPAETEEELEAGRRLDLETSIQAGMPAEFAMRRALRKKEVFQNTKNRLLSYHCNHQGHLIGKCELYIRDGYAKIEDFDVLNTYQRKGFGTALLKRMIVDAMGYGVENIYLVTAKDDTPREMYGKLGFEAVGEELELFWGQ